MSHFSRLKTKIKDKDTLLRCLKECGYQVQLNGRIKGFRGKRRDVEIAVRMREGYDIGFVRRAGGNYDIIADWWGVEGVTQKEFVSRLQKKFEEFQRHIHREYALKTVLEQTKKEGFNVVEQKQEEDGSIRLVVRRWV